MSLQAHQQSVVRGRALPAARPTACIHAAHALLARPLNHRPHGHDSHLSAFVSRVPQVQHLDAMWICKLQGLLLLLSSMTASIGPMWAWIQAWGHAEGRGHEHLGSLDGALIGHRVRALLGVRHGLVDPPTSPDASRTLATTPPDARSWLTARAPQEPERAQSWSCWTGKAS